LLASLQGKVIYKGVPSMTKEQEKNQSANLKLERYKFTLLWVIAIFISIYT